MTQSTDFMTLPEAVVWIVWETDGHHNHIVSVHRDQSKAKLTAEKLTEISITGARFFVIKEPVR